MNFMGIGLPEIAVIFLVAFLVLGPGRSVDMARSAGRLIRQLRQSFSEMTEAINLDRDQPMPPRGPAAPSEDEAGREQK